MAEAKRKTGLPFVLIILGLTVFAMYFGWRRESFARELSDERVIEQLDPEMSSRDIQHALSQLYERLGPRLEGREKFRAPVVALKDHKSWEVRRQAAWVMGRDPATEYQETLVEMLKDSDPGVRYNAACSLANFNDARARPQLIEALSEQPFLAPIAGTLALKVEAGKSVSLGSSMGHITNDGGDDLEIRPPFNCYVNSIQAENGAKVEQDQPLMMLSPDPKNVAGVLVALRFVGHPADLEALLPYAQGKVRHMSDEIQKSAEKTIDDIQRKHR